MTSPFRGQIAAITVPLVAPSVNHYKQPSVTRAGHIHWRITPEATAFKDAMRLCARRQMVRGKAYKLEVWIFLGKGQRGDGDNFFKVTADALVEAGVIDSDAKIINWHLYKRRDPANPRTELVVEAIE